jgi:hypothetical protein
LPDAWRVILRLDPTVPVVWRSPTEVQLGVDPVVCVFDGASQASERLLAALAVGVPESGLSVVAEAAGVGGEYAAALLEAVRPALLPDGAVRRVAPRTAAALRVAVDGSGPVARRIAAVLAALGVRLVDALPALGDEVDAAVLVGSYAIATARHGAWLRRDVPHLGVVFGERRARIGPFVEPGVGPCLACLDLARGDDDPAWPLIAAQLAHTRSPVEGGRLAASVALRVAHELLAHVLDGSAGLIGASVELAPDGTERRVSHAPHARCGCRALPGSETADVLPLDRFRSRSSSAATAASLG